MPKRPDDLTVDQAWDMYLRALADSENMRKRHRIELQQAREQGEEDAIKKMLPIIDNLERGNQAAQDAKGRGSLNRIREGFGLVTRQAHSTLNNIGVNPFDCQYQQFDPERMDAIARTPTADVQPGHVIGEVERGYTRKDRLLRPAKVAVAIEPEKGTEDA